MRGIKLTNVCGRESSRHGRSGLKIEDQMDSKIMGAQKARDVELCRIVKPTQVIMKSKGRLIRHHPGQQDAKGDWQRSRTDVAMAWQKQFSDIENADPVTFQKLLQKSMPRCKTVNYEDLVQALDVEAALRNLQDTKATGVDGLGIELFQCNIAQATQRVLSVHLKTALRRQNVPELTGGLLLPLHKGKTSPPK